MEVQLDTYWITRSPDIFFTRIRLNMLTFETEASIASYRKMNVEMGGVVEEEGADAKKRVIT